MSEQIPNTLKGVSETLLMPLYVRARETRHANPLIRDEKAVEMVNRIDFDFSRFRIMHRHDELAIIVRMNKFDSHVRDFLKRSPGGVVVHIGCGLDTRFERVDNGSVEWFDLDIPEVVALRQKLLQNECARYHLLACSVFEEYWLAEVSRFKPRSFMFIAEGVLPYFEEIQVKTLFQRLGKDFPGCDVVFDALSPFGIWADNLHLAMSKLQARMHWRLRNCRDIEAWGDGFLLLDEWNYYQDVESPLKAYRIFRLIPVIAESAGIYRYRLGERP